MIRSLFKTLIQEELRRDAVFRDDLLAKRNPDTKRDKPPLSITMPAPLSSFDSEATPRANDPRTPGLSIGVATPGAVTTLSPISKNLSPVQSRTSEEASNHRSSTEARSADYFEARKSEESGAGRRSGEATKPTELPSTIEDKDTTDSKDSKDTPETEKEEKPDKEEKEEKDDKKKGRFGMKFPMTFPTMKLGRTSADATKTPTQPEDNPETTSSSKSSEKDSPLALGDTMLGVIHRLRRDYDAQQLTHPDHPLLEGIVPSPLDETPPLEQPAHTLVLVQEDDPEAGGVVDLYRGMIGRLAADADVIERVAPVWLGELLLRVRASAFLTTRNEKRHVVLTPTQNQIPAKEPVKVSFTLHPYKDELPSIATADGSVPVFHFVPFLPPLPLPETPFHSPYLFSLPTQTLTQHLAQQQPPERKPHAPRQKDPQLRRRAHRGARSSSRGEFCHCCCCWCRRVGWGGAAAAAGTKRREAEWGRGVEGRGVFGFVLS